MIFSEKKLREIANIDNSITLNQIVDAINSIGFEVESVEQFNKNKGLKFGHVLNVEKNPNSTKLNVCTIEFNDKQRIIQTAAQNVKNGDYLIAFVPGSIFQGTKIEAKELGGITSHGMLVSFEELGFNRDLLREEWKNDILIIDKIDLNLDPIEYFELNDNLIDVTILTNRSDAQCYYILARELSAFFKTKYNFDLKDIKPKLNNNVLIKNDSENKLNCISVELKNEFKIDIKKIMFNLKSNLKSINDFDDFANYLMLLSGVYPRIIDQEKIKSNKLELLEKNKIHYLMDKNQEVSILGINVCDNYKPNKSSKKLLFECSQIDLKIARSNSRYTKIVNQSSINSSKKISNGSLLLLHKILLNTFSDVSNFANKIDDKEKHIKFDEEYLVNYAGEDIKNKIHYKNSLKALEILGFIINKNEIIVPLYRHDIDSMQDIVEEIFRFYGLNNFEAQQVPIKSISLNLLNSLEKNIIALGYTQAWTYTLINSTKNNEFNPFNFKSKFNLKTFVSEEFNSIRNSMALPLFDIYDYNIKRKMDELSLFDIGMINDKKALIISSNVKSYSQIKSDIQKITNQKIEVKKLECDKLHPSYNASLHVGGKQIGWIGKFNPYWINSDIIFAEILIDSINYSKNIFAEYDSEPLKERDVTISVNKNQSALPYLDKISSLCEIYSIKLISTFEKNQTINWSYKIKLSQSSCEIFDKNINSILETKIEDLF